MKHRQSSETKDSIERNLGNSSEQKIDGIDNKKLSHCHRNEVVAASGNIDAGKALSLFLSGHNGIKRAVLGSAIFNLQRGYGNRFVQRALGLSEHGDIHPGLSRPIGQVIESKRGRGQSLDNETCEQMETAFDADFGGVRVHNDTESDTINRALNSRAFATGQDIFFRNGQYSPGSSGGRGILAHELTHVVQQSRGRVRATGLANGTSVNDDPSLEREADAESARVTQGLQAKDGRPRVEAVPADTQTEGSRPRVAPLQRDQRGPIQRTWNEIGRERVDFRVPDPSDIEISARTILFNERPIWGGRMLDLNHSIPVHAGSEEDWRTFFTNTSLAPTSDSDVMRVGGFLRTATLEQADWQSYVRGHLVDVFIGPTLGNLLDIPGFVANVRRLPRNMHPMDATHRLAFIRALYLFGDRHLRRTLTLRGGNRALFHQFIEENQPLLVSHAAAEREEIGPEQMGPIARAGGEQVQWRMMAAAGESMLTAIRSFVTARTATDPMIAERNAESELELAGQIARGVAQTAASVAAHRQRVLNNLLGGILSVVAIPLVPVGVAGAAAMNVAIRILGDAGKRQMRTALSRGITASDAPARLAAMRTEIAQMIRDLNLIRNPHIPGTDQGRLLGALNRSLQ